MRRDGPAVPPPVYRSAFAGRTTPCKPAGRYPPAGGVINTTSAPSSGT